jgi:hypothetical protein
MAKKITKIWRLVQNFLRKGSKHKNKSFIFFDNLVHTWAFHNLKEKVKKCVFKCVIIQKENDRANSVACTKPVALTVI